MKTNILILLLLFQLIISCTTSSPSLRTPQTYSFEIKWGPIFSKNGIQKLTYNTNTDSLILYKCTDLDSIISYEKFKVTRPTADSIFYLCNINSKKNEILEGNQEMTFDGYEFQISLQANHKVITDKYGNYRIDKESKDRLSEIYNILNRITLNKTNLHN